MGQSESDMKYWKFIQYANPTEIKTSQEFVSPQNISENFHPMNPSESILNPSQP